MERQIQKTKTKATATDRPIHLPEHISVANLASALNVRGEQLFKKLSYLGYTNISPDHVLNAENASLIAMEYGFEPRVYSHRDDASTSDLVAAPLPTDVSSMPQRPPVVTIMGHVDHGKTTILDYLRKSSIAASEHGGITQHIGAFMVPLSNHPDKTITFLDTPGHAAFLTMRQRGANVTDIVVLVVAADDSVMPQTVEAIKHARAAEVPVIVAVNKVDKDEAKPEKVKQDLARHGVEVEDFGGDVQCVEVSGKTGKGMKELEEAIVTLSEVLEKRAPTDGLVEGWVLEATKNRSGKIATVLVRRGTLRPGDVIVAGTTWARVRSLRNEAGVVVTEACPGTPVEVEGWKGEPGAGDEVLQAPNEDKAGEVVDFRLMQAERKRLAEDMEAINETRRLQQEKRQKEETAEKSKKLGEWGDALYGEDTVPDEDASTGMQEVYFIVKADVAGSAEAVINAISALGNNEVRAHVLRFGTGAVSEFDVEHAAAAKGHIIAFNTRMEPVIVQMAAQADVRIVDRSIIYRVVEDVTAILSEKLPPRIVTSVTGEAEIAQLFDITVKGRKKMKIAGCKVRNGLVKRGGKTRVLRGTETIYDGKLAHFQFFER
jgi:translation initiation factor IF-2